jgi:hypothetical protein
LLSKVISSLTSSTSSHSQNFLELVKINHYKAPRDKLICILNCCKVIFGSSLRLILSTVVVDLFPYRPNSASTEGRGRGFFRPYPYLCGIESQPRSSTLERRVRAHVMDLRTFFLTSFQIYQ